MRRLSCWFSILVVVVGSVAACGSSNPVSPSAPLSGVWSGAITGDPSGVGTARLELMQAGSGVTGTFATTYPDPARRRSGAAGGTALGNVLTITLTPTVPEVCTASITLTGTLVATLTVAGDRISGSYSGLTCGGATGGTLDLRRE